MKMNDTPLTVITAPKEGLNMKKLVRIEVDAEAWAHAKAQAALRQISLQRYVGKILENMRDRNGSIAE
jgi:hypothetical protein